MMDDSTVLKKRGYTLGINLGEGSYAKVKAAFSDRLKLNVAVKIIDRKKAPADFLERFLPREMEILAAMNHRSIVKTYEIFETSDGKVYIVMELGVQGDLLDFIKTRGALPEDVARRLFTQLVTAVKYCHDLDIVHRDLKCENLLLDKDFNMKLTDFGFARRLTLDDDDDNVSLSKTFCGSAAYAAPEVLQGIPYSPKGSDVWSLGVILFIMVCGSMPYDDSNIKKMLRLQREHRVDFPRSKHLSNDCKDLNYRILQPDATRRLTVEEILSHTWLQSIPKHRVQESASVKKGESPGEHSLIRQKEAKQDKATTKPETKEEPRQDMVLQQEQASTSVARTKSTTSKSRQNPRA